METKFEKFIKDKAKFKAALPFNMQQNHAEMSGVSLLRTSFMRLFLRFIWCRSLAYEINIVPTYRPVQKFHVCKRFGTYYVLL